MTTRHERLVRILCSASLLLAACGDSSTKEDGGGGEGGEAALGGGGAETQGGSGAGVDGEGNFVISPPYDPAPETVVDESVPQGTVSYFDMSSAESEIYPVDVGTGEAFTRSAAVYVPQQYVAGDAAPFMVVQDGLSFYAGTMVPVLDNMIAAGTLPVMVVIFVEPGPDTGTPDGERSYEYDSVSEDYVTFVETELLPRVEADYGVTLTTDPEGRAAMGGSSGGAAAFTMGWFRPDLYRRILTYSGSFCNLQPTEAYPDGAWEYHASLIANEPAKPLRVFLSASENDLDWNVDGETKRNWVEANEAMAAALADKGYHYRYVFAEDADHIDGNVLGSTLPATLQWLWQGYPAD